MCTLVKLLFFTGGLGLLAELLMIAHWKNPWQLLPVLLVSALLVIATILERISGKKIRLVFLAVLAVNALAGLFGVLLHLTSNYQFAIETYGAAGNAELLKRTLMGAMPVFAPASLIMLSGTGILWLHIRELDKIIMEFTQKRRL